MDTGSVTAVFRALNDAGVRNVVVGGLAVLAHGILRATNDIHLFVTRPIPWLDRLPHPQPDEPVLTPDRAEAKFMRI